MTLFMLLLIKAVGDDMVLPIFIFHRVITQAYCVNNSALLPEMVLITVLNRLLVYPFSKKVRFCD